MPARSVPSPGRRERCAPTMPLLTGSASPTENRSRYGTTLTALPGAVGLAAEQTLAGPRGHPCRCRRRRATSAARSPGTRRPPPRRRPGRRRRRRAGPRRCQPLAGHERHGEQRRWSGGAVTRTRAVVRLILEQRARRRPHTSRDSRPPDGGRGMHASHVSSGMASATQVRPVQRDGAEQQRAAAGRGMTRERRRRAPVTEGRGHDTPVGVGARGRDVREHRTRRCRRSPTSRIHTSGRSVIRCASAATATAFTSSGTT